MNLKYIELSFKNCFVKKKVIINGNIEQNINNLNSSILETSLYNNENQNKNKELEIYKNINNESITTRINNLTKIYSRYIFCCFCKKEKIVLNKINLALKQNEKFGLLGFNGAGKSTLIKSIINEIEYEGEIFLYNEELKNNFLNY